MELWVILSVFRIKMTKSDEIRRKNLDQFRLQMTSYEYGSRFGNQIFEAFIDKICFCIFPNLISIDYWKSSSLQTNDSGYSSKTIKDPIEDHIADPRNVILHEKEVDVNSLNQHKFKESKNKYGTTGNLKRLLRKVWPFISPFFKLLT